MSGAFIQTPVSKISDATDESASQNVNDTNVNTSQKPEISPAPSTKNSVRFGETPISSASSRRRASVIGLAGLADRRSSIAQGASGGLGGLLSRGRRQSMWGSLKKFSLAQGSNNIRESLQQEEKKKLENTYQLKPTSKQMFKPSKVEQETLTILENELEGMTYNPLKVSFLSKTLSDKIKAKVKQLGYNRHKLVVYVVVGSLLGQGMELTSRCIWDERSDDCVSVRYQNGSVFAVALVFGVYFE